ncbi:MAG TPA: IS630 family transposase [Syntrophorhabdales bacterium]|nr:IS630 family transposase [Syntrophorhabdales bacterium]
MPTPIKITVSEEQKAVLEGWTRKGKMEKRYAERAKIILLSSAGERRDTIARRMVLAPGIVSKWRRRFLERGMDGLFDLSRPGKPPRYDEATEQRILDVLDKDPPKGFSRWNGPLVAKELGDVSVHQVWRVLRTKGVSLERRHSWCVSTDPAFTAKAADIIGLYLSPPEGALVISVDEKPCIQVLERAQGYLRLPNGRALTGFSHEYKRHGTTTLFAALDVMKGQVKIKHTKRRRRRQFLDFMNGVIQDVDANQEVHVILDNLSTHKPKNDGWLTRHKNVHFHYTPTHASWLNQVEIWFSILQMQSLRGSTFTSAQKLRQHIDAFTESYNADAQPFEWHKVKVTNKKLESKFSNLCK